MKGYFGFLVVFAAFALLLSLVEFNLNSKSHDLSSAITSEKLYGIQMNVKEVIIEAAREGAKEGFNKYVEGPPFPHSAAACSDPKASACCCFRVLEANTFTVNGASAKLSSVLSNAIFDDSVTVGFVPNPSIITSEIVEDPASISGHRLSSITISPTQITITSKKNPSETLSVFISNIKVDIDEGPVYT